MEDYDEEVVHIFASDSPNRASVMFPESWTIEEQQKFMEDSIRKQCKTKDEATMAIAVFRIENGIF